MIRPGTSPIPASAASMAAWTDQSTDCSGSPHPRLGSARTTLGTPSPRSVAGTSLASGARFPLVTAVKVQGRTRSEVARDSPGRLVSRSAVLVRIQF